MIFNGTFVGLLQKLIILLTPNVELILSHIFSLISNLTNVPKETGDIVSKNFKFVRLVCFKTGKSFNF